MPDRYCVPDVVALAVRAWSGRAPAKKISRISRSADAGRASKRTRTTSAWPVVAAAQTWA
jgi:hypothetical protein